MQVEDAFVGLLARESGVRPIDISELIQDPPAGREQVPAIFAGQMLVHRVQDFEKAFAWITWSPLKQRREERRARGEGGRNRRRTLQEVAAIG